MSRYYYDVHTGKCKLFYYGGCQGNGNNFMDERDCIDTCVVDDHLARDRFYETPISAANSSVKCILK
jgi:hypothetical protein